MSYTQLYFNRVELFYDGSQIRLSPNFQCPMCNGRPEALLDRTWNCNLNKALEINQLVNYVMPCCNTPISLFVAVHKEKGSAGIQCCIQKSSEEGAGGIPADWWVVPEL